MSPVMIQPKTCYNTIQIVLYLGVTVMMMMMIPSMMDAADDDSNLNLIVILV
jgi:hypothetical protein